MKNEYTDTDIAIVGYGPVGAVLGLILARQGYRVQICERWQTRYPLPRAVCIDHEMYRMLCAIGLRDALPSISHPGEIYRWMNAQWRELISIDWSAESVSGGSEVNFVHQPTLEATLDEAIRVQQNITLNLGCEAIKISQDNHYAYILLVDQENKQERTVKARYVIGADGANSIVREAIGSGWEDKGFEADWLVVDVLPNDGVKLDIPAAAQYCNPQRPTTIVPAGVKNGRYFRRWEFMRLPGEDRETLENERQAWQLLEPWVKPEHATMVRHKLYTFRSLIADTWRAGRLLIAGDAAHVMPPFMGQGMCAGLRDAWNLGWKLDLILSGKAEERLLDSYMAERRPHVSDVIDLSMYMGKIICIPDDAEAARRDEAFFNGTATPPPPFPSLVTGLIDEQKDERENNLAGLLSPHSLVRSSHKNGRLDDVIGPAGFKLILTEKATALNPPQRKLLEQTYTSVWQLVSDKGQVLEPTQLAERDEKFLDFMRANSIVAMLVRPDFYIYGSCSSMDGIDKLLNRFMNALIGNGIKIGRAERVSFSSSNPDIVHY